MGGRQGGETMKEGVGDVDGGEGMEAELIDGGINLEMQ